MRTFFGFKPHYILGTATLSTATLCAITSLYLLFNYEDLPKVDQKELVIYLNISLIAGFCGATILFKDRFTNCLRDYTGININGYLVNVTGQNVSQHCEAFDQTVTEGLRSFH